MNNFTNILTSPIVTIFGGTGFIGHNLTLFLSQQGYRVKIVSRTPELHKDLKVNGPSGKVICIYGDLNDENSVKNAIKGSDIVINLVGILHGNATKFSKIHARGAEFVAKCCLKENVKRLIHISALGIDKPSGSIYAKSKLNGEKAVLNAFKDATIFRPSVVYGAKDNFINMFAKMSRTLPIMPLIGSGKTKFQPIHVDDVSKAIIESLQKPDTKGKVIPLAGNKIYNLKQIIEYSMTHGGKVRPTISIPFPIANFMAYFLEKLPGKVLTMDQVKLLKVDNILK